MFPSDVKLLKIFSYDNSDTVTFIALQRLITSQLDSLSVETRPDLRLIKQNKKTDSSALIQCTENWSSVPPHRVGSVKPFTTEYFDASGASNSFQSLNRASSFKTKV